MTRPAGGSGLSMSDSDEPGGTGDTRVGSMGWSAPGAPGVNSHLPVLRRGAGEQWQGSSSTPGRGRGKTTGRVPDAHHLCGERRGKLSVPFSTKSPCRRDLLQPFHSPSSLRSCSTCDAQVVATAPGRSPTSHQLDWLLEVAVRRCGPVIRLGLKRSYTSLEDLNSPFYHFEVFPFVCNSR